MADESVGSMSAGWLSGLYRWLKGTPTPPAGPEGSADSDARDRTPSRIGHYTIRRKIGAGGMGVVYQAYDERLERTVALKMMLSLDQDETARKRFWREARAAASVNHPHVCQVYEVVEHDGQLFIAMELLEGEPLVGPPEAEGRSASTRRCRLRVDMLAALGAIHARGIVHRDLKPSNVYLTSHGVKLLDFGLARPGVEASLDESTDRPDPQRRRDGDAALHVARSGDRRSGRRAQRSLRGRRHPVRDARRAAGVCRPHGRRGRARDPDRTAARPGRLARRSRPSTASSAARSRKIPPNVPPPPTRWRNS